VAETVHKTPSKASSGIQDFKVGSPTEWIDARKDLLVKEKEFTRLRDQVCLLRWELPWERVERNTSSTGQTGRRPSKSFLTARLSSSSITSCSPPSGRQDARAVHSGRTTSTASIFI
jgi:hypothetical protein